MVPDDNYAGSCTCAEGAWVNRVDGNPVICGFPDCAGGADISNTDGYPLCSYPAKTADACAVDAVLSPAAGYNYEAPCSCTGNMKVQYDSSDGALHCVDLPKCKHHELIGYGSAFIPNCNCSEGTQASDDRYTPTLTYCIYTGAGPCGHSEEIAVVPNDDYTGSCTCPGKPYVSLVAGNPVLCGLPDCIQGGSEYNCNCESVGGTVIPNPDGDSLCSFPPVTGAGDCGVGEAIVADGDLTSSCVCAPEDIVAYTDSSSGTVGVKCGGETPAPTLAPTLSP